jgi:hypothetical protein
MAFSLQKDWWEKILPARGLDFHSHLSETRFGNPPPFIHNLNLLQNNQQVAT